MTRHGKPYGHAQSQAEPRKGTFADLPWKSKMTGVKFTWDHGYGPIGDYREPGWPHNPVPVNFDFFHISLNMDYGFYDCSTWRSNGECQDLMETTDWKIEMHCRADVGFGSNAPKVMWKPFKVSSSVLRVSDWAKRCDFHGKCQTTRGGYVEMGGPSNTPGSDKSNPKMAKCKGIDSVHEHKEGACMQVSYKIVDI